MERIYTIRLQTILESLYPDYNIVNPPFTPELIDKTHSKLFDFDYPWYEDGTKSKDNFETMFCATYLMEQISVETVALFKHYLWTTLIANMPEYTQIFKSLVDYDLLYTFEETESSTVVDSGITVDTTERQRDLSKNGAVKTSIDNTETINNTTDSISVGTNTENSNSTNTDTTTGSSDTEYSSNTQDLTSDTPQINFASNDYASGLNRGQKIDTTGITTESDTTTENQSSVNGESSVSDHSTSSGENKLNGNTKTENESQDTESSSENHNIKNDLNRNIETTRRGFNGDRSELILKYRKTIYNLNKKIVDDCKKLFMGVW